MRKYVDPKFPDFNLFPFNIKLGIQVLKYKMKTMISFLFIFPQKLAEHPKSQCSQDLFLLYFEIRKKCFYLMFIRRFYIITKVLISLFKKQMRVLYRALEY